MAERGRPLSLWEADLPADLLGRLSEAICSRLAAGLPLLLALFIPFVVYLRTLCPTLYSIDGAELPAAAFTLGIAHANGYPTYILIAWLFTRLPIGDVAYRVNLMSAVFGALTVALVYRLAWRLSADRLASLIAALLLAFSYFFWTAAVVAEVYTLHTFFFTLILQLLLRWRESGRPLPITAAAFLFGLALGNHLSMSLLAPGFLALAMDGRSALRPSLLVRAAAAGVAGLLVYAYLPLRFIAQTPFNAAGYVDATGQFIPLDLTRADELWGVVSASPFHPLMFAYSPAAAVGEFGRAITWLWGNFLGGGLIFGLWGLIRSFTAGRPAGALVLLFLPHLVFFANYAVVDKEVMFLPTYVSWALWLAIGLADLREIVGRLFNSRGQLVLAVVLLSVPITALVLNFTRADASADRRARVWSETILETVEPNAYVVGWWTRSTLLRYLQLTENRRPDVRVIDHGLITEDALRQLIDARLGTHPVYFLHREPAWEQSYRLVEVGGAYRLLPKVGDP